ncbi:cobalt-precorrin-5B (C(1))-methyltransferase CbiD [Anaeroselena agilis]|uniref:Cobalt-precorrin-5B C(1)-methyltransferase n=1 Tax=Anaeroselena agilis TaxID=3063788 RepID=A0ABU3NY77_9FIRM|nr:cobalt-precorrin-5B (C(1))-methyltransferase CbiD [Selenomonadales bacterium 4137-cl]
MSSKTLRRGITTGTCAAAAAKAAVLAALGRPALTVEVATPQGNLIPVGVAASRAIDGGGSAAVVKDAGDDPDVTDGVTVAVDVVITADEAIVILAGEGVGTVTKPGLAMPVGQPAVNPGPRLMIETALRDVLPAGRGAVATIAIPGGRELAARTLNPALGIEGGLSVIGTTGIVEPMSEEAWKTSLTPQLSVVKALGHDTAVFVPGKIGQDIAINKCRLPADRVVQTSNFVGHMLESAADQGLRQILLFGHLGKIVKVAAGIFHTHSRMADARLETLAAYAAAEGAPREAVEEILACVTTEAAVEVIGRYPVGGVWRRLAAQASSRAARFVHGRLTVGTAIVTLKGDILGRDDQADKIGGTLGWIIK